MKTKKEMENFTKYVMREAGTEAPSESFVTSVMGRVRNEVIASQPTVYQPVISKSAWILIIAVIVATSVFLLTGSSEISLDFLSFDINMSSWVEKINILSTIQISDLITISVFIFTVMVVLQIFFIMRYMSKRMRIV